MFCVAFLFFSMGIRSWRKCGNYAEKLVKNFPLLLVLFTAAKKENQMAINKLVE